MRCASTLPLLLVTVAAVVFLAACSSAGPAPTDTPAGTTTPDPSAMTATAVAAHATRFSYASVRPNIDASPTQPADREGNLRITWRVNPMAPVGPGTIVVKCNGDTVSA